MFCLRSTTNRQDIFYACSDQVRFTRHVQILFKKGMSDFRIEFVKPNNKANVVKVVSNA